MSDVRAMASASGRGILGWLGSSWEVLAFGAGLIALAFLAGMLVAHYRVFPYPFVREADEAVWDWKANWRHYLQIRSRYASISTRADGATVHQPALMAPGITFVTAYRGGSFHAFLVDPQGRSVHEWDFPFSKAWPDPPHLDRVPADYDTHNPRRLAPARRQRGHELRWGRHHQDRSLLPTSLEGATGDAPHGRCGAQRRHLHAGPAQALAGRS
jgi:hypothetical protein